jgi:hypothetical protein
VAGIGLGCRCRVDADDGVLADWAEHVTEQNGSRHTVRVSPFHSVALDDDYFAMIRRAPQEDFVVRTLARRMAGEEPLMLGELVIAGQAVRERFPLAAAYPLHFRKTYAPGHLRGNTRIEFERHTRASQVLRIPPPIGRSGGTIRSCLLPGRPFDQELPFGAEPEASNIRRAENLSLASAAGLWLLAERALLALQALHGAGMTHGDSELHNFIVCYAPLEVVPIDFDMAVLRESASEEAWAALCAGDLLPLLKAAVYLQCALGAQEGPLAELSLGRIDTLFPGSEPFRRAIEERAGLLARMLPLT